MPTVFYVLAAALAAAILIGFLRPVQVSRGILVRIGIVAVVTLIAAAFRIDRHNYLPIAAYIGIVWGISAAAAALAQLVRSRGLPRQTRFRMHIGSLAFFAGYTLWVGPIGQVLIAAHLEQNPGFTDSDGTVRQTTPVTCGPASLATAMARLGVQANERDLSIASGTSLIGTSRSNLERVAKQYECRLIPLARPLETSDANDFPALVSVNLRGLGVPHLVAVTRRTDTALYMADPSNGGRWIGIDDLETARWGEWYTLVRFSVDQDTKVPPVRPVGIRFSDRPFLTLMAMNHRAKGDA